MSRHTPWMGVGPSLPTLSPKSSEKGGAPRLKSSCGKGGSPALSSLADPASAHPPYTPRTNGKAERFIQTALREWAYSQHWSNSEQRDAHLQPWTDYYNGERPHGSLNYKPPISRSDPGTTS